MSTECFKCKIQFINIKDIIECSECKTVFHPTCTKLRTMDKFAKLGSRKATWKCDICKSETLSDKTSEGEQTLDAFKDFITEFINSKFNELNLNIIALNTTVAELNISLQSVCAENERLKVHCEKLEVDNLKLQQTINELRQYSYSDNLEIVGIPETDNEDIYSVLESTARAIDVPFKREDISIAHRVPSAKVKTRPIIVRFISRSTKILWKDSAKTKGRLSSTEIHPNLPKQSVYLNEHLTSYNKYLLGKAKGLAKNGDLAFVWVREGRILVRKSKDAPAKRISHDDDLLKLQN
jgi:hypothetical protein